MKIARIVLSVVLGVALRTAGAEVITIKADQPQPTTAGTTTQPVQKFNVQARPGVYRLTARYRSPGPKAAFEIIVNGIPHGGTFTASADAFADFNVGLVELHDGDNALELRCVWGSFVVDELRLETAKVPPPPAQVKPTPCDPLATLEAKQVLKGLSQHYGKTTLTGVYSAADAKYVQDKTGAVPTVFALDFILCSPSLVEHGAKDPNTAETLIDRYRLGHIVSANWTWNAPSDLVDKKITDEHGKEVNALWYRGFMTYGTTFDMVKAIDDESSDQHKLLLRDIDAVAVELQKLSDAKVPLLWRPLHEAEGAWFWWGAHGPERYVKLWRLMFDRLTKQHGLHNLLWVFTAYDDMRWYPGDDCVDVVGVDAYPTVTDPLTGTWETIQKDFAGRKFVALAEFGGVPDIPRMQRMGVWWSYFVSWSAEEGPRKMNDAELKRIYTSRQVTNLEK